MCSIMNVIIIVYEFGVEMREKIYKVIENNEGDDALSNAYDVFMMIVIIISMIPLMLKTQTRITDVIDTVCVTIFIIDYILRFITADYKLKDKTMPFLRYPFTFMAIVDLLSILPSVAPVTKALKALRLVRLLRLLKVIKVFRAFKTLRYSKSITIIVHVIERSKDSLIAVCTFAIGYIYISALLVFNVEPDTFKHFFEALYWATVSLTTVGYGDIYPTSEIGRAVSMISSIFGIAVVALPAGIITAGYMTELESTEKNEKDDDNGTTD